MADQDADKTQEATQFRRDEARSKGQVARSHDLAAGLLLIGGFGLLLLFGEALIDSMGRYTQRQLGGPAWLSIDADGVMDHAIAVGSDVAATVLPIMGLLLAAAIGSNILQTGLLFQPDRLMPDWSHVSIIKGFGRIFSLSSAVRLGFGLLKLAIGAAVAAYCVYGERDRLLNLSAITSGLMAKYLIDFVLWTSLKVTFALLMLALADYLFQYWKHEQDLRMTHQEVREEMKELQGDPQILSRRRQIQRQLVMNRLKTAVPKADVVITNPTEFAVAIQYKPEEMFAPVVVAKGAGVLAQRIRRLALEHGIPIIENKPLARQLYADVEINRPVPDQTYAAVAEVLAYVYRLKGKTLPKM